MHHGGKAAIPVLANDTGSLVAASVAIAAPPGAGTATPLVDGRIRYEHTTGLPADDQFTYQVTDETGVTSTPELVTIAFSTQARLAATTLNLPPAPRPPATRSWTLFPG